VAIVIGQLAITISAAGELQIDFRVSKVMIVFLFSQVQQVRSSTQPWHPFVSVKTCCYASVQSIRTLSNHCDFRLGSNSEVDGGNREVRSSADNGL
jgi:hypothetical protein